MKKGSIATVLGGLVPWPPPRTASIFVLARDGVRACLFASTDGRLTLEIQSPPGELLIRHETQPISIRSAGMNIFMATWDESQVQVFMNNRLLKRSSESMDVHQVEVTEPSTANEPTAVDHPEAGARCQTWVDWRKTHLGVAMSPRPERRLKTEIEQLAELETEVTALSALARQIRAGHTHMLHPLAGRLRALLCWKMQGKRLSRSYNPLLLRLAARAGLALPVFAMRPSVLPVSTCLHITNNVASLRRRFPGQELCDVQAWLEMPMSTEVFGNATTGDVREITVGDAILDAANTLGGAHFDEDVPEGLDTLRNNRFDGHEFLGRFLLESSDLVVDLGEFVVRRTRERGETPADTPR